MDTMTEQAPVFEPRPDSGGILILMVVAAIFGYMAAKHTGDERRPDPTPVPVKPLDCPDGKCPKPPGPAPRPLRPSPRP